jgi:hypothetical protein
MGTQHYAGRRRSFTIDPEWEDLAAPMFCDFTTAEFVGQRLGGHVREESSSSSFFTNKTDVGTLLLCLSMRTCVIMVIVMLSCGPLLLLTPCRPSIHCSGERPSIRCIDTNSTHKCFSSDFSLVQWASRANNSTYSLRGSRTATTAPNTEKTFQSAQIRGIAL